MQQCDLLFFSAMFPQGRALGGQGRHELDAECAGMWNYNAALGTSSGSESRTPHTTADASPAKVSELCPPSCTAFAVLGADVGHNLGRVLSDKGSCASWLLGPCRHRCRPL